MTEYAYFLVDSTAQAMRLEKILMDKSVECKLVPVPRQFSSDCGLCARVPKSMLEPAVKLLAAAKAAYREIVFDYA